MRVLVVIPARMASTRLPGKPLADIAGRPMILRVLDVARAAQIGEVAVACADPEIAAAVTADGGRAVLTDPALPSGSDRVWAALAELDPKGACEAVVNLQGDMPTLAPEALRTALTALAADPAIDIATLAAPTEGATELADPNIVKAVLALDPGGERGRALYFTRAPAPSGPGPVWRHVGLYAYRRAALARFTALPPSPLETRERLEQLRALEAGMRIDAALIAHYPLGVDTPEDLARARAWFAAREGR